MDNEFESWSKETNLADGWINVSNSSDDNIEEKVNSINGVKESEKISYLSCIVGERSGDQQLSLVMPQKNVISLPTITKGSKFDLEQSGIWIDEAFANANNYQVGDTITLWSNDTNTDLKIKGLIISSSYIAYTGPNANLVADHKNYGYAYTNNEELAAQNNANSQIMVNLDNKKSISELKTTLTKELGTNYLSYSPRNDNPSIAPFVQKIQTLKKISIIFSVVIFLLIILTVSTTMQRLIENQQNIIGTLKALGVRNNMILVHYVSFGFLFSGLGNILGLFLGPKIITKFILDMQKDLYLLPKLSGESSKLVIIAAIILFLIVIFSSFFSVKKTIKEEPANILRPELIGSSKNSIFENFTGFWNNLSFEWKWVLRDTARNKKKTILAVIGISGSLILLFVSMQMQYSYEKNNENLYGNQYQYFYKASLSNSITSDQINEIVRVTNNGQFLKETQVTVQTAKKTQITNLQILDKGVYFTLVDQGGEIINLENEGVVITSSLAQKMNIKKNDSIDLKNLGNSSNIICTVSNIASIPSPQGIFLSSKMYENLFVINYKPTAILTGDSFKIKDLKELNYVSRIVTMNEQLEEANTVLDTIQSVIILIMIIAALLGWTVLYNLGTLNLTERYREYATMKVLGFRQREIVSIILKENMFNFLIGFILSLPFGVLLLNFMISTLRGDTIEYFAYISFSRIIFGAGIVMMYSLAICLIVALKIKKINMIEALKSIE